MTPKEKATELVSIYDKMLSSRHYKPYIEAKKSALIVCDEVLWETLKYADDSIEYVIDNSKFWQEVKQEIQKL